MLLQGYIAGVLLAFGLTMMAVSTQMGRDLRDTLTSMFNPLPATGLLPLALLWFGLLVESLGFATLERLTVRRWGQQRQGFVAIGKL